MQGPLWYIGEKYGNKLGDVLDSFAFKKMFFQTSMIYYWLEIALMAWGWIAIIF